MPFIVYSPDYHVDLGPHVFPVEKYRLCYERLIGEGTIVESDVAAPVAATGDDLLLVHTPGYLARLRRLAAQGWGYLTPDTPISPEILDKSILVCGGSITAGRLALRNGVCVHLNGGFHHASADNGEGFCYLNDVAVAIRRLQVDGEIGRAAVIDCDLHQGNGTALIFAGDESVYTFSIHEQGNYPGWKPPSDLDIGLRSGVRDEEYLAHIRDAVPAILRAFGPDLAVYLAGADPYEHDQLGRLALTMDGLRRRDEFVLSEARSRDVPVLVVLAGGYAQRTEDTVEIHCNTVRAAKALLESHRRGA
jgi:acetoin utilization deacetylase AcuC-like enzyme